MIVNCPKCSKKTALLNDVCEHCGAKVKHCPECENIVEQSQKECDYCGYSFDVVQADNLQTKEIDNELKKKAVRLASFAEQENKKYHKIAKMLSFIGWIVLCLSLFVPILMLIDSSEGVTLEELSSAQDLQGMLLVIGVITAFASYIFKELRNIISSNSIIRQVEELKFDYKEYYKYGNAVNNIASTVLLEDNGELQLVQAIRYKEDPSKKLSALIKKFLLIGCYLLIAIFGYIGIDKAMDGYFTAVLFHTSYSFKVNTQLILAVAFWVLSFILDWFLDKDMDDAMSWIDTNRKK